MPRRTDFDPRIPRSTLKHPPLTPIRRLDFPTIQQAYTDDLLRQDFNAAKDWCYTGVGVLEWDAKMRDYLKNNDWRYPIVAREGTDERAMDMHVHEVVTLRDMLLSFEDPAAVVRLLAAPSTKIVSLTITEYGYRVPLNEGDHKLLELHCGFKLRS